MYHFTRLRRSWMPLLVLPTLLFLFHYYYYHRTPQRSDEIFIQDDIPQTYLYSSDDFLDLYSSEPPAHRHSVRWNDPIDIPETRVYAHIPGFTVLENVYSINGTIILITDHKNSLPETQHIISAWAEMPGGKTLVQPPTDRHIRIVNPATAMRLFGLSAREIRGTTWLCNDPLAYVDETFILGFLRTHYMQEHRAHFNDTLLPPRRVLFPRISSKFYRSIPALTTIPRLLFPTSTTGFKDDWDDYAYGYRPILLRMVVITDKAAASRNPALVANAKEAQLNFAVGSYLSGFRPTDGQWWSAWRRRVVEMLGMEANYANIISSAFARPVITYVSRQQESEDAWLYDEHHRELVEALNRMAANYDFEVHIVNPRETSFLERVRLMLKTTILMGVTGSTLYDSMWMPPSSTLIEFFPENYLSSSVFQVSKTVGIHYVAWRGSRAITPPDEAHPPSNDIAILQDALETATSVDSDALVNFILARLQRDQGEMDEDMRKV